MTEITGTPGGGDSAGQRIEQAPHGVAARLNALERKWAADELRIAELLAEVRRLTAENQLLREIRVDLIGTLDRIAGRDSMSEAEEADYVAHCAGYDACEECDSVEIALAAYLRRSLDSPLGASHG
jgi:hypothetical protein